MCQLLNISRASYYKKTKKKNPVDPETHLIEKLFIENKRSYGTRRLKKACNAVGVIISRRRIRRIMRYLGINSVYTVKKFKPHKSTVNEEKVANVVDQEFDNRTRCEVLVSDLTYVRVGDKWHYICTIIDLYNREIIGYSCGPHKTAQLVLEAFASIPRRLQEVGIFHTDRGSEFKNTSIDALLKTFDITRSLSHKGTPYDNAVAEATYKTIKTEFVSQEHFETLEHLKSSFGAYVWWFNNKRLHSSLNYVPPVQYHQQLSS
jgi:transposase InsO family protein